MDFQNEIFSEITALNRQPVLGDVDVTPTRLNQEFEYLHNRVNSLYGNFNSLVTSVPDYARLYVDNLTNPIYIKEISYAIPSANRYSESTDLSLVKPVFAENRISFYIPEFIHNEVDDVDISVFKNGFLVSPTDYLFTKSIQGVVVYVIEELVAANDKFTFVFERKLGVPTEQRFVSPSEPTTLFDFTINLSNQDMFTLNDYLIYRKNGNRYDKLDDTQFQLTELPNLTTAKVTIAGLVPASTEFIVLNRYLPYSYIEKFDEASGYNSDINPVDKFYLFNIDELTENKTPIPFENPNEILLYVNGIKLTYVDEFVNDAGADFTIRSDSEGDFIQMRDFIQSDSTVVVKKLNAFNEYSYYKNFKLITSTFTLSYGILDLSEVNLPLSSLSMSIYSDGQYIPSSRVERIVGNIFKINGLINKFNFEVYFLPIYTSNLAELMNIYKNSKSDASLAFEYMNAALPEGVNPFTDESGFLANNYIIKNALAQFTDNSELNYYKEWLKAYLLAKGLVYPPLPPAVDVLVSGITHNATYLNENSFTASFSQDGYALSPLIGYKYSVDKGVTWIGDVFGQPNFIPLVDDVVFTDLQNGVHELWILPINDAGVVRPTVSAQKVIFTTNLYEPNIILSGVTDGELIEVPSIPITFNYLDFTSIELDKFRYRVEVNGLVETDWTEGNFAGSNFVYTETFEAEGSYVIKVIGRTKSNHIWQLANESTSVAWTYYEPMPTSFDLIDMQPGTTNYLQTLPDHIIGLSEYAFKVVSPYATNYKYRLDNNLTYTSYFPINDLFTLTGLSEGSHILYMTFTNKFNDISAELSYPFTVIYSTLDLDFDFKDVPNGSWSNSPTLQFTVDYINVAGYRVRVNGGSWQDGVYPALDSVSLLTGANTVEIQAKDALGDWLNIIPRTVNYSPAVIMPSGYFVQVLEMLDTTTYEISIYGGANGISWKYRLNNEAWSDSFLINDIALSYGSSNVALDIIVENSDGYWSLVTQTIMSTLNDNVTITTDIEEFSTSLELISMGGY